MRYFIGLDIGGTKIEGILVNDKYKIIKKNIKKTEADKPREITLKNIFSVIKELKQNYKLSGIGISTAGYVKNKGLVNCPNIPNLNNINIIKDFKKNIKEKFIVENDANCFALAENIYWKKKKFSRGYTWYWNWNRNYNKWKIIQRKIRLYRIRPHNNSIFWFKMQMRKKRRL